MNKKLIALAVVGATFAPAVMAQSANPVTLYGRVWVMANSLKADGGATPLSSRTTVADNSSLIGFRGTEDLGGGLKAFFQIESAAGPDAGGGSFASRNSGVGLQGGFGSVVLGRWDSPMKLSAIFVDPFGQNTIGAQNTLINSGDFNRREINSVQYWSPNIAGFSARVMYGANEGKTATANPHSLGFSLDYATGPFRINYANQKHTDYRGATVTAGVVEKQQNLSASAVFGPIKIAALTQKAKLSGLTDRKASEVSATYTVGKNQFHVNVARLKNGLISTAALQPEAKLSALGYDYNFSKRTTLMARYAVIKNNGASAVNLVDSNLPTFAVNNDPKGFGAGIRHTF
ncbi:MAG: porin [Betaproteobacteria bacterium]|nr:porin [Betaproteobacteria bacterium]